jgi:hypothetical protein
MFARGRLLVLACSANQRRFIDGAVFRHIPEIDVDPSSRQYREASEQLVVVLAPVGRMKAEDLEEGFFVRAIAQRAC